MMTKQVNIREIALGILMEITEEEAYSHIVLREVLEKYQYLEKRDRAFISRVVEGTLEHMIQLDYIIEQFSNVPVYNMKPLIRNLLRMSVYQLKYMDSVPDSAVCNEAVKIAQRRGFYNLKGFVNGVLRNTARRLSQVKYPDENLDPLHYLSVRYSFPIWMLDKWMQQFGYETTEKICRDTHMKKGTVVRCDLQKASKEEIIEELKKTGLPCGSIHTSIMHWFSPIIITSERFPRLRKAGSQCRISVPCWWQRQLRQTGETTASMSVRLRVEKASTSRRN